MYHMRWTEFVTCSADCPMSKQCQRSANVQHAV